MIDELKELTDHELAVAEDIKNCNGRFITFRAEDPRRAAYDLCKAAKAHFRRGHVSNVSYGNTYGFQITSKRPGQVLPGCVYEAGVWGEITYIAIK